MNDHTVRLTAAELDRLLLANFDAEATVDYTADELDALWDTGGAE